METKYIPFLLFIEDITALQAPTAQVGYSPTLNHLPQTCCLCLACKTQTLT